MRKRVVWCRRQHGHSRRLLLGPLEQLGVDESGRLRGLHLLVEGWTRWRVLQNEAARRSHPQTLAMFAFLGEW